MTQPTTIADCKQGDRCRLLQRTQVGGSQSTLHWSAGVIVEFAFELGADSVCVRPAVADTGRWGVPRSIRGDTPVELLGNRKDALAVRSADNTEVTDPLAQRRGQLL